jgi:hypothetical protein
MFKTAILATGAAAVLAVAGTPSWTLTGTGNGAPSGSHYNLNIIGTSDKSAAMDDTNRHVIFVGLNKADQKIMLTEADDYSVLDGNATDGDAAEFALPNPDPDGDGTTTYSVFARALGAPGGGADMTTCAVDEYGDEICSVATLELRRTKGKSTFDNVSAELLYIYADIDGDGDLDRVPLFDESLQGYFWDYDNNGLRLAQLRFYECSTTVGDVTAPGEEVSSTC